MRPTKPKPTSSKLPNHDRNYKIPKNLPTTAQEGRRTSRIKFNNGSSISFDHTDGDELRGFGGAEELVEFALVDYAKISKVFEDRTIKLNTPVLQTERHDIKGISKEVAEAVIARANGQCEMCDRYPNAGVPMQISHTIAKGMGGTHGERSEFINSVDNLRFLCEICHLKLFHGQSVRYYPDKPYEQSCVTCWLFAVCHETAVARGILEE